MNHIKIINTKKAPIPIGPYVQAIDIGNLIFISGQIPILPNTNTIPETVYDQTYQSLKNIKNIIEEHNLTIQNIVKTTLFITNINDLPEINSSYTKFFHFFSKGPTTHLPTRSCIEISNLPQNAKIEIEAIAAYF